MRETTNVENLEIAGITCVLGEKALELDIGKAGKIGVKQVKENNLKIPDAEYHEWKFDEQTKSSIREYDGKVEYADFEIMKQEIDTRKKQGRKINKVPEIPKITQSSKPYTILENGEIER